MVNSGMRLVKHWLEQGSIRPLDYAFAQLVYDQEEKFADPMAEIAAKVSARAGQQHSCVPLSSIQASDFDLLNEAEHLVSVAVAKNGLADHRPLVLDNQQLYLHKYWHYERQLAASITTLAGQTDPLDTALLQPLLQRLFTQSEQVDWQKVAVCAAARQRFSIITGGPGTGKTTTVTRLMAILQAMARHQGKTLAIRLAAPTGKAAARLNESVSGALATLPEDLREGLQISASTLHRLLGSLPHRIQFKANRQHPLHLDLLILDEASMVDLPLMAKTFDALPPGARVVLLGDQQQLSSVEQGSVLADICAAGLGEQALPVYSTEQLSWLERLGVLPSSYVALQQSKPMADNLVVLQKSHRFSANSGIGQLASAFIVGDYPQTEQLLNCNRFNDIEWLKQSSLDELWQQLLPDYQRYFEQIKNGDLASAFACLGDSQVLCAFRLGTWGIESITRHIEQQLRRLGMIDAQREFYDGRPVMLGKNLAHLDLYNGDIGICLADPEQPGLTKIWFRQPHGVKGFLPSSLTGLETVYAMTIHKSQGSEFKRVLMCLPDTELGAQPLSLTRELLYTGLTRAKSQFGLFSPKSLLIKALSRCCQRSTGLALRLKG